jgi:hypothetical protein
VKNDNIDRDQHVVRHHSDPGIFKSITMLLNDETVRRDFENSMSLE